MHTTLLKMRMRMAAAMIIALRSAGTTNIHTESRRHHGLRANGSSSSKSST